MPYEVTRRFEQALCTYTGAPYAVAVNSCTAAIMLAIEYNVPFQSANIVEIPKRTYVSVPNAIKRAGCSVRFREDYWHGMYQLHPFPVWDCALRFTSGMYARGHFQCVSFAAAKILGIEQGGAILHDNAVADRWFRRMRYDGRHVDRDPREDEFDLVGHHCFMLPSIAAQAMLRLHHLPLHNADQVRKDYPDLSKFADTWR